jgi:GlpG protein
MRLIASINNTERAERLADYLRSLGIACTVDAGGEGARVWVHNDDQVGAAKEVSNDFLADPNHERYRDAAKKAMARFQQDAAHLKAARKQTVNLSERWNQVSNSSCPATFVLMGLMLFVAIFVGFMSAKNGQRLDPLWFSNDGTLAPILHGEFWRVVSPIFLHVNVMHLTFNMIMIYQLGQLIESRLGSAKFLSMVLVIAAISNFAEFLFHTPLFGGMSGVNYGLFGYCWIKGRIEPEGGFALNPQAVTMMLVWFVLCVVGVIPNVANWVHGAGLATGIIMAFAGKFMKSLTHSR